MILYRVTVKETQVSNGICLQKGMSILISSKFKRNPLMVNQGQEVYEAFMTSYGVDLRGFAGGRIAELVSEIEVVRV
jgi:hypothetical protein